MNGDEMYLEYIGHGCYFIRTPDLSVLVDPLLGERFQDGTAIVFPRRVVDIAGLPRPDMIIVTHCHPGHLEVPSLALLDRSIPVLFPNDTTVELALRELGFEDRRIISHGDQIKIGETRVVFTGSVSDIIEIGVAVSHSGKLLWHLADSEVDYAIIDFVRRQLGEVDFLIANYAAYNNQFFSHFRLQFPIHDVAFYIEQASAIAPKALCANFVGFIYEDEGAWINRFMFPTQRRDFLEQVASALPDATQIEDLIPGDRVVVEKGRCTVRRGAANYVRLLKPGSTEGAYDPTGGIPVLRDPDLDRQGPQTLRSEVTRFLREAFYPWLVAGAAGADPRIEAYRNLRVVFRLIVVLPDDAEMHWDFDLTDLSNELCDPPLWSHRSPNVMLRIAASTLLAWARSQIPYYRAYFHARSWSNIYAIARGADGRIAGTLFDGSQPAGPRVQINGLTPVSIYLNGDVERTYHPWIRKEIAKILRTPVGAS